MGKYASPGTLKLRFVAEDFAEASITYKHFRWVISRPDLEPPSEGRVRHYPCHFLIFVEISNVDAAAHFLGLLENSALMIVHVRIARWIFPAAHERDVGFLR